MTADRVERDDLAARHPDVVRNSRPSGRRGHNVPTWIDGRVRLANWGDPVPAK